MDGAETIIEELCDGDVLQGPQGGVVVERVVRFSRSSYIRRESTLNYRLFCEYHYAVAKLQT